jgi:hypothetical protein
MTPLDVVALNGWRLLFSMSLQLFSHSKRIYTVSFGRNLRSEARRPLPLCRWMTMTMHFLNLEQTRE